MEKEELELIQRLKDTQAMQQAAFQQLEEALNTGIPMAGAGGKGKGKKL